MRYINATDTLAYQLRARPLTTYRDLSATPMHSVAKAMNRYMSSDVGTPSPESCAITFYMMNHAVSLTRAKFTPEEPLGVHKAILDGYHRTANTMACRMFYYLLVICVRESRHLLNRSAIKAQIIEECGQKAYQFVSSVPDNGGQAMHLVVNQPPDCTLGAAVKALRMAFYIGAWSGGYGGNAWGDVCSCLESYVTGKYTAEMMLDTSFTLCHNNGPIFNKGMFFSNYGNIIYRILDIQRAGMIPQAMASDTQVQKYATPEAKQLFKEITALFPELNGIVDWYKVEALGSKGKYPSEKKAMGIAGTETDYTPKPQPYTDYKPEGWTEYFKIHQKLHLPKLKSPRAGG